VTAIRADDLSAFALRGEDRRRNGYELSQFPQILGGGAQQELVFRSARPAQAQSVEPEDALQVSKSISTFLRWLRETAPIQPRDLLNERNERPGVDGRRTIIGQFGRRSGCHRLVPAP